MFSSGGSVFYLRLAGSEFENHKKGIKVYVIVIIGCSALVLFVGLIFFLWKNKKRMEELYRRLMKRQESLVDRSGSGGEESGGGFSTVIEMHEQGKDGPDVPLFSFQTIEEATESFSSSNLLGVGGFGPVYKGTLPGGQDIAVKRLSRTSGQGMEEFKNEVILIAKLQHRNLVRRLGYCIRRDDKMLVYESRQDPATRDRLHLRSTALGLKTRAAPRRKQAASPWVPVPGPISCSFAIGLLLILLVCY